MVVGAEAISGGYLECFSGGDDRAKLVAVADTDSTARQCVAERYNPELLLSDYRQGLHRKDIGLVVVCTPHNLHHQVVMDSLRAGKHVFCEKPIAISVSPVFW